MHTSSLFLSLGYSWFRGGTLLPTPFTMEPQPSVPQPTLVGT